MKTKTRSIVIGAAAALLAIQLVPIARTNPPVESDVEAPPEVKALLRRACYDCHSHETAWPAYSRIAPVSWLVASDVSEGRGELNFSRWGALDAAARAKLAKKIPEEVGEGEMPPLSYRLVHPHARLTDAERVQLESWARSLAK